MTAQEIVQAFLDTLAPQAAPSYQELMHGIADYFREYRTLSRQQRKSVRTTASILKIAVPSELELFAKIESMDDDAAERGSYLPLTKPIPITKENPLQEMLLTIAAALTKAANRL